MKRNLILILTVIATALLIFTGCAKTPAPAASQAATEGSAETPSCCSDPSNTYINNDLLVVTEALKYKLDGQAVILDARDEKSYKNEHIKGAVNVSWQQFTDMSGKKPGDKGWGILLDNEKLAEAISRLGVDGTKPVILYGASPAGWGEEGRIAWTLKMAGIKDVKLLNGGWDAWKKTGYQTDTIIPEIKACNYTINNMDETLNATTAYIKENLSSIKLIDARDPDEFSGAVKYGEPRGGHLPKAINVPWTEVFDKDGFIKSQKPLDELFSSYGLNKNDNIVVYCTKGIRSAHMTLMLRMAGYSNARNYDASFYEWAGDTALPLEK